MATQRIHCGGSFLQSQFLYPALIHIEEFSWNKEGYPLSHLRKTKAHERAEGPFM